MSLVLGLRLPREGRCVVVGDTRTMDNGRIIAPTNKVAWFGPFVVGTAGDLADRHAIFHGLDDTTDILDPKVMTERFGQWLTHFREHVKKPDAVCEVGFLIARGTNLYEMNSLGQTWPTGEYTAIGSSWSLATHLLRQRYSPDLTIEKAIELCENVIAECALSDPYVALPVQWMAT